MNAIEIKHATKRYTGFTLDDVSFALPKGCILGLVGENGAGKTTMISMLLGIVPLDDGEITMLGVDSRSPAYDAIKQDVGVVLDESCLPDALNAKQLGQVMRGTYKRWSDQTYADYLRRFDLPDRKIVREYSRGMKMKLALAVALSHDARLLVLDEATSGLDPMVRDELLEVLVAYTRNEQNSILISSHIVTDLEKLCDYIAFMHKGKLLFVEEKDALIDRYALLKCNAATFDALDKAAVKGARMTPYGVEALVLREGMPRGITLDRAGIEEIIVFLAKGGDN